MYKRYFFFSQLRLVVYDSAYPSARDTCDVLISVLRDESGPIFQPSATYQITIPETTPIGSEVLNVDAIDPDGVSHPYHRAPNLEFGHYSLFWSF